MITIEVIKKNIRRFLKATFSCHTVRCKPYLKVKPGKTPLRCFQNKNNFLSSPVQRPTLSNIIFELLPLVHEKQKELDWMRPLNAANYVSMPQSIWSALIFIPLRPNHTFSRTMSNSKLAKNIFTGIKTVNIYNIHFTKPESVPFVCLFFSVIGLVWFLITRSLL